MQPIFEARKKLESIGKRAKTSSYSHFLEE